MVPRSYKGPGIPCSLYISGPARKVEQSYHYLERLTFASRVPLFFARSFSNYRVQSFRLLLITPERFVLAT